MHHLVFYIGLGAGLAATAGVRPFFPALIAAVLGLAGILGVGFDHSGYHFVQGAIWIAAMAVLLVASYAVQARIGSERFADGPAGLVVAGIGMAAGALMFAGTLAHYHETAWPGLIGGVACALLANIALRPILAGARARLGQSTARETLTVYLDAVALVAAILVCALHPLGYVALALLLWLLVAGRRRGQEKYAGLRVLRR